MRRAALRAVAVAAAGAAAWLAPGPAAGTTPAALAAPLAVPVVRQAPERCGPAALEMVLRYYGAGPDAVAEAERAYDPALRGALITDLAEAARRAGFEAETVSTSEDTLQTLLASGVPPILLYRRGVGPMSLGHYGVVVGWDPARERYAVNDGGATTRQMKRDDLMRRWRGAGALALVVRRATR
jgi:ABC-type bacteriocin/lantibiotic exporter with double-glycine peptidase domain